MKFRVVTLAVVILAGMALWSVPARAESQLPPVAGSVYGAHVRGNPPTLSAGVGWPSTYVRFDFRARNSFVAGLQLDLFWGMPVWGFSPGFGFGFSAPMRIQVMERQQWALALLLKPGLFMGFGNNWYWNWYHDSDVFFVGPNFEFGLIATVTPVRFLNVFFGLRNSLHILVAVPDNHDAVANVFVPFLFFGGVELAVARNIAVFSNLALGPTIGNYYERCERWVNDRNGAYCVEWHDHAGAEFTFQMHFGANFHF